MTMNKLYKYQYLGDASIRVDNITLKPWPDFTAIGGTSEEVDLHVQDLLVSDDPCAMLWRAKIPDNLLNAIQRFPDHLWCNLLELSQLHVDYFLQWSQSCPALIGLMAIHSSELQIGRDLDRIHAFYRDRHERLKILGLPPTREVYHILAKLPAHNCYPEKLEQLRAAVKDKTRRKLMSHLKVITEETLETVLLPVEFLDIDLLMMSSGAAADSVASICAEIADFRRRLRKMPYWPYRGSGISYERLRQVRDSIEVRLALGSEYKDITFPKAPVDVVQSSKLKLEAITSVRDLFREGNSMENCITTYARAIMGRTHYAYRMTSPERATVLLVRRKVDWYPIEIRGPRNASVAPQSIALIRAWLGTEIGEEVRDDFPF